ncbi:NHL1-like protein [Mya arenaria]|uniref:NHL1-like protein n=1 Tax=Mya arenaria TaxID=6604 RepID=A0ABY7DH29_MYAAR|nr:NHL1-like protein [Mya arenaria]
MDRETSELSYSAQHIQELLRCPICLDRFNTPKLLPCQHTFCESPCLQQFHRIKCPECREEHRVPYAGVSAFPTNRTILNFLDVPTQPRQHTSNQMEPPEEIAMQGEPTANQNPGQPQNEAGSQNEPANENPAPARTGCTACGRQLTLSRCLHCDNVVCDTCKRSHMEQLRLDINRLVSQLRRSMPNFSDAVSVIERKSEQLHQRAEAGKAEITETIERFISELRNRQRLLHSEVQMWLLGEIRSLRMVQENVEVELASTASFCDSTESALARNQTIPDDDLVEMKRQCIENMEIVRTYEGGNGVRLPRERQVQVAFDSARFSQMISNFGDLRSLHQLLFQRQAGETILKGGNSRIQQLQGEITPQAAAGRGNTPQGRQPQGATAARGNNSSGSQLQGAAGRGSSAPSLETALNAIGSSAARRGDRMAALIGGGGARDTTPPSDRPHLREQLASLIGQENHRSPRPQPRQTTVERSAGMMGGGVSSTDSDSSQSTPRLGRRPAQSSLSWELDLSHPPHGDLRAGNGNRGNRRSLQERRRHNLTDPQLSSRSRVANSRQESDRRNHSNERQARRNENQSEETSGSRTREPVPGTSSEEEERPSITRSRTFTREEFQTIREEDNVSRASTADAINRRREPIRFDVDLASGGESGSGEEVAYIVGTVDGGESTRVNVPRNNYQDKGRAIIRFGARGSNPAEFIWPRGIAVSGADQIYVADSSNHRVQVFDNIGTFIKSFGSYGQADNEFDCLAGIGMNTMGDILITDRYNHRVQVFDHQGSFKFVFGEEGSGDGQMNYPWGISCDSMGFIYVCDKENHRIQVFQSNGIFARKFGRLGRHTGQFENPHYLAISSDNKVYVSDSSNHRIQVFTMYGDFIFQFGTIGTMQGQMKYPKGIAIDEQGFVVVADSGNNRIQVFRGDGRFYCMFGSYGSDNGQFKGLEGLAILGNGNVTVSDRENHRIQIF